MLLGTRDSIFSKVCWNNVVEKATTTHQHNELIASASRNPFLSQTFFPAGNKCDSEDRIVDREDGERLAREYKVNFMETSAKTGLNVELAFIEVARYVL